MATACVRLIEYQTDDGSVFRLKVSPAVAEALKGEGGRLKEVTFTDLGDGRFELTEEHARRRPAAKGTGRKRSPWEGPRFPFTLFLGEHRPGWNGGPCIDERGRCGLCHGQKLIPGAYCLGCERCGRELEIPGATVKPKVKAKPATARRKGRKKDKLRGGLNGRH